MVLIASALTRQREKYENEVARVDTLQRVKFLSALSERQTCHGVHVPIASISKSSELEA